MRKSNFEKYNDIVDLVKNSIEGREVDSDILDSISKMDGHQEFIDNISSPEVFTNASEKMNNAIDNINTQKLINSIRKVEKKRRATRRQTTIVSLSFAAAILVICFVIYNPFSTVTPNNNQERVVVSEKIPILIIGDSVVEVNKKDNKIIATDYIPNDGDKAKKAVQQRLIIPNGQTYTVVLPDGSEVELNACSELSYSSNFGEDSREVTLKGEAYFEVTKSDRPFIVNVDKSYVKVYGTSFNVDAKSEGEIKTVLIKGKVGVGAEGIKEILITPNQLVTLNLKDKTSCVKNIDVTDYLGWKMGYFKCIDNSIITLIDDLSLWYGVEFRYDKNKLDSFKVNMSINRNLPIDETLRYIEDVTELKFIKKQDKIYDIEN